MRIPYIEIDGRPANVEQLRRLALVNDGHLTVMQVRDGAVRGLALHLARLDQANRELYGVALDPDLVRARIRHALRSAASSAGSKISAEGASVRVVVFPRADGVAIMVAVSEPAEMPANPLRLCSFAYQRPFAHIKHVGSFGQIHLGRLARRRGFDDALLTGPDGVISEGAITNIGFIEGAGVVWPDAPALHGVTMALLEERLADIGLPSRRARVRLADLPSFRSAFVTNSRGIAPVAQIDNTRIPVDTGIMNRLMKVYDAVPWDPI